MLNHPLIEGKPASRTDKSTDAQPIVTSFEFGIWRAFEAVSLVVRHTRITNRFSSCKLK